MDSFVGARRLSAQTWEFLCYSPPSRAKTVIVDTNKCFFFLLYCLTVLEYTKRTIHPSVGGYIYMIIAVGASGEYLPLATSSSVNSC